jgi:hypothetical protein
VARSTATDKPPATPGKSLATEYRKRAADCLTLAQQLSVVRDRAAMVEMAQHWLELAQRAEEQER